MYNDKKRRIVAGVIVAILVIAMVLPLLSYAL
jgi:type II secretory pathway component PulF